MALIVLTLIAITSVNFIVLPVSASGPPFWPLTNCEGEESSIGWKTGSGDKIRSWLRSAVPTFNQDLVKNKKLISHFVDRSHDVRLSLILKDNK